MQLGDRALEETQRVLSARGALRSIGDIAAGLGTTAIPLKGALTAIDDDQSVDLADVDVLCHPDYARQIASALDASGYRGIGFSSDQHLRQRVAKGALHIEIHLTPQAGAPLSAEVWERTVDLEFGPGLRRLAAADHLWYTLEHLVLQHPFRRGSIRDLCLIGNAAAACTAQDLKEVADRIQAHPSRSPLATVLRSAQHLAPGSVRPDSFERAAGVLYFLRMQARRFPIPGMLATELSLWVYTLLFDDQRFRVGQRIAMASLEPSVSPPTAWMEERLPRLGALLRRATRLCRFAIAIVPAVRLAVAANRAVSKAVGQLHRT